MAVIVGGKVYVDGLFIGCDCAHSDGTLDIDYDKQLVYVIDSEEV